MAGETSERVHRSCPTCTCEQDRYPYTIVYAPNAILYGTCGGPAVGGCGQVKWQSETWTKHKGSITPARKTHCGCCRLPCPGHVKGEG